MKNIKVFYFLSVLFLIVSSVSAQDNSDYKIINRIHLDGDGGWDYLTIDESSSLLYVSHGNIVQVLDTKTSKLRATIEDTKGVHGIAIATDLSKGYISCGKDSTVLVFDIRTFKTIGRIKVDGANPDAILYDPFSQKVFSFNGRSKNATIIDTKYDKVIANIPLEGKPEFAVADGRGKVYVNIEDKGSLCQIDSKTLKVENYLSLAPVDEPSGLAIDTVTHRLFSVSDGHMVVIDASTGTMIDTLPIGDRVDGVAFDKGLKRAYSANGDGTMTIVGLVRTVSTDRDLVGHKYKVLETVKTQKGARTIAVDAKTHHIYLPTADFGEVPAGSKRPAVKPNSFTILEIAPTN